MSTPTSGSSFVCIRRPRRSATMVACLAVFVGACQSPTESVPIPVPVPVTLQPAAITLPQGQDGAVAVSLPGLLAGSMVNWTVSGGSAETTTGFSEGESTSMTTLALVVGSTVPAGSYQLTVSGSAAGVTTQPAQLLVTVSAASETGSVISGVGGIRIRLWRQHSGPPRD